MKTLEEFQNEIAEYILTLRNKKGDDIAPISTRNKWCKVLNDIALVVVSNGHEEPDEKDYEEYRTSITVSDETFDTYKKKIKLFFSWSKQRRHEAMIDATMTSEVLAQNEPVVETGETKQETLVDSESSQGTGGEDSNAGRKRFDTKNGEKRDQKLMLYLTPSVIADVRDWCKLKDISAVSYITDLIVADMENRQDKLNSFRQLRDEA